MIHSSDVREIDITLLARHSSWFIYRKPMDVAGVLNYGLVWSRMNVWSIRMA